MTTTRVDGKRSLASTSAMLGAAQTTTEAALRLRHIDARRAEVGSVTHTGPDAAAVSNGGALLRLMGTTRPRGR